MTKFAVRGGLLWSPSPARVLGVGQCVARMTAVNANIWPGRLRTGSPCTTWVARGNRSELVMSHVVVACQEPADTIRHFHFDSGLRTFWYTARSLHFHRTVRRLRPCSWRSIRLNATKLVELSWIGSDAMNSS